ncbi:MAG: hypothetical protein NT029_13845 [Armatimonadetes bacterium]|nr:hypothetical protein [Armatimonadota bacterium]
MRRAICSALALLLCAGPGRSQGRPTSAAPPSPLPVARITLFNSGVSYTERAGQVEGDATVPLTFRTAQINDILKSMVLLDAGGKVQPAVYAAKDPVSHALRSFAIDVTQNLDLRTVLDRLRGVLIRVDVRGKAVTGRLAGVELRQNPRDARQPMETAANLLTDRGLVSVAIQTGGQVRILDERLDQEFRDALALLATGNDEQRRQVTLRFAGQGKRQVRVGYVTEAPLWKMSYRLVLGGKGDAKPYLQGWAHVENTSDDDWNGVALSLVSGRPVSFIQDLYQPLYLPRPVVGPDVVASAYPQTHGGNLLEDKQPGAPAAGAPENGPAGTGGMAGGFGGGMGGRAAGKVAARNRSMADTYDADSSVMVRARSEAELMRESVDAQASGQQAGELFKYDIATPLTLPRQQAAMIPVIAGGVDAEKVSIYNADTGPRYPLNAIRIKNNTGLHLKGGPITVFDEETYAGDAKMEDVPKGDARYISYAVDLSVEGDRRDPGGSSEEVTSFLRRGVLTCTRTETRRTEYTLKSRAEKARTVIVEQPILPEFTLAEPKEPSERTSDRYRFTVALEPGKSRTLNVVETRPVSEVVGILDAPIDQLALWVSRPSVGPKLKTALEKVIAARARVRDLQAQAAGKDEEIKGITADQDRVRQNMQQLDRNSDLYKRYVKQLDEQETRMQTLRTEAAALRKQAAEADQALRAEIDALSID